MADRVLSGRYRIVRHLARGGMAEVYLAHDQLLDRPVAVKVLFPELASDASFVERFRREARAAAGLNHHNIVSAYDFGEDEGSYFIVMEYVEGETVRDIIRTHGAMPSAQVVELGAEMAAALGAAHSHNVIHRDMKSANVIIDGNTAKVADFGIARAGDVSASLTQTGAVMGTATYLSPEQAQGHDIDNRSDLYSLGVVLYEMATGRAPFAGASPVAIAYKHLTEVPTPPSTHNLDIPPGLDAVILKAMAKDPADRQQSAEELRQELLAVGAGAGPAAVDETVAVPTAAASSTVMLPSVSAADEEPATTYGPGPGPVARTSPDVYRRRRNALIGLVVLVLLGGVVIVALSSGGGSSATAVVPPVVGLDVTAAEDAVHKAGFNSAVDARPDRTGDPGKVVEQIPVANATVKKSTTVTLVVPGSTTSTTTPPTTRSVTTPPTVTTAPSTTTVTTTAPTTVPPTIAPTTTPPTTKPATTTTT